MVQSGNRGKTALDGNPFVGRLDKLVGIFVQNAIPIQNHKSSFKIVICITHLK